MAIKCVFVLQYLNVAGSRVIVIRKDLKRLNEILDKLTKMGFFEYYVELRDYYEYLADKYHFDLKTHTVNRDTGEIVPRRHDRELVSFICGLGIITIAVSIIVFSIIVVHSK